MIRPAVLFPAVQKQLREKGYYGGEPSSQWDEAAERAWIMYCDRHGFRPSPQPDIFSQEPDNRDIMLAWYEAEQAEQDAAGIPRPEEPQRPTLYELIKTYSEEVPPPGLEDEIRDAQRERGLLPEIPPEAADRIEALEGRRQELQEEQRRSIQSALRAAKKIERKPRNVEQFAVTSVPAKAQPEPNVKPRKKFKAKSTDSDPNAGFLRVRGE